MELKRTSAGMRGRLTCNGVNTSKSPTKTAAHCYLQRNQQTFEQCVAKITELQQLIVTEEEKLFSCFKEEKQLLATLK